MALSEVSSTGTPVRATSSGASSVFNPYDTTQLHAFIREAFSGATLMEEHQASGLQLLELSNALQTTLPLKY